MQDRRLFSTDEAARYTGHASGSIRNMIHKGILPFPYIKQGKKLLFDKRDLDRWIDSLPRFGGPNRQKAGKAE
jgi:excisionase family DNA binding protein